MHSKDNGRKTTAWTRFQTAHQFLTTSDGVQNTCIIITVWNKNKVTSMIALQIRKCWAPAYARRQHVSVRIDLALIDIMTDISKLRGQIENPIPSINAYLRKEHYYKIST